MFEKISLANWAKYYAVVGIASALVVIIISILPGGIISRGALVAITLGFMLLAVFPPLWILILGMVETLGKALDNGKVKRLEEKMREMAMRERVALEKKRLYRDALAKAGRECRAMRKQAAALEKARAGRNAMGKRLGRLMDDNRYYRAITDRIWRERQEALAEVEALKERLECAQRLYQNLCACYEDRLAEAEMWSDSWKEKFEAREGKIAALKEDMAAANGKYACLYKVHENKLGEIGALREKLEELEKANTGLQGKLDEMEAADGLAAIYRADMEKELAEARAAMPADMQALRNINAGLEQSLGEARAAKEEALRRIDEHEQTIENLQMEIDDYRFLAADLNERLADKEECLEDARAMLCDSQYGEALAGKDNYGKARRIAELESEIRAMQDKLEYREKRVGELFEQKKELEETVEAFRKESPAWDKFIFERERLAEYNQAMKEAARRAARHLPAAG